MMGFYLGPKPVKNHDNRVTDSLKLMDSDSDPPLANQDEDSLKSDLRGDQEFNRKAMRPSSTVRCERHRNTKFLASGRADNPFLCN